VRFPLHWVEFGAHMPVHDPLEHTFVQGEPSFNQVPSVPQACGWFPLHCRVEGRHAPEQAVVFGSTGLQTNGHCEVSFQVPLASHVRSVVPLQLVVPGAQTPVQPAAPASLAFATQRNEQTTPLSQVPSAWQVKNFAPVHFVSPGRQTPVQAPDMQTFGQVVSTCHAPFTQARMSRLWQAREPDEHADAGTSGASAAASIGTPVSGSSNTFESWASAKSPKMWVQLAPARAFMKNNAKRCPTDRLHRESVRFVICPLAAIRRRAAVRRRETLTGT
jgi:hypothetical protein